MHRAMTDTGDTSLQQNPAEQPGRALGASSTPTSHPACLAIFPASTNTVASQAGRQAGRQRRQHTSHQAKCDVPSVVAKLEGFLRRVAGHLHAGAGSQRAGARVQIDQIGQPAHKEAVGGGGGRWEQEGGRMEVRGWSLGGRQLGPRWVPGAGL